MTEISIIIPVYNTEKYLGKCIDSILESENAPEYEIIFINDGSTDSSGEILDDYSVHHDNIRIYTIENSGAAAARNYGIQRAVGKYIVFIDSDDTIASNCLELLYDAISLNDADMVQIGEEIKGFSNETRITCGKNDAIKFFARGKVFSGTIWSKIYKRSSVQSLVMVGGLAEDQMFILDVLSNNYKFVSIGGVLYIIID